jgi:hypothetical protein
LNKYPELTTMLSVRNVSISNPVEILEIDIYDSEGSLIQEVLTSPIKLRELETFDDIIPTADISAGRGGNYIIKWRKGIHTNNPLIEATHYGALGHQGFTFISHSVLLNNHE